MAADIAIKGIADIEVIKHRIYEVRGMRLKSQTVTSNVDNLTKGVELDHLFMANPLEIDGVTNKTANITGI